MRASFSICILINLIDPRFSLGGGSSQDYEIGINSTLGSFVNKQVQWKHKNKKWRIQMVLLSDFLYFNSENFSLARYRSQVVCFTYNQFEFNFKPLIME